MSDTSADTAMVRTALYRRMSSDQRTELAVQLSEATRAIALENIRRRHPDYSDGAVSAVPRLRSLSVTQFAST